MTDLVLIFFFSNTTCFITSTAHGNIKCYKMSYSSLRGFGPVVVDSLVADGGEGVVGDGGDEAVLGLVLLHLVDTRVCQEAKHVPW